ncbi:hypothetical protein BHE74_00025882 [Ensete ventricosum]|nr:hypothetical protein GW17_00012904 [Ensete ventricosum]RWW66727.1 hypothetical protein BHE74_00025882 [Ensete ventricosum]
MHLSENEGIEGKTFVVTGGLGFVGAALCLELVRRGAVEVRSLDPRPASPWSIQLRKSRVELINCRNRVVGDRVLFLFSSRTTFGVGF